MLSQPTVCINSIDLVESDIKCEIFVCVVFWRQSERRAGVPPPLLWDQSVWVGLLHVSIPQHLLPLTFRPTPTHTLFPQRMLHARGRSEARRPQLQGISPGVVPICCSCCVRLSVSLWVRFVHLSAICSGGLPDLQTERADQNWQWKFK